ncbi:MAG: serine hydrolase, partial [Pseudomonadota bacterium]
AALIVLQDGRVRLERYGLDFRPDGRWTSFSVAKSFTSTLVGMAIVDGYIESLYVSVADYIPGLRGSAYEDVTVAQLLTMSSGIAWNEDYGDPNSDVARFSQHVTADDMPAVVSYMRGLARAHPAGEVWNYSTGETNLIGILVSAATGQKLTDYLSSRIWERIGMQQSGTWILGPDGHEISGCCIQAAAMDFARFGQFMLEGGVVDGEALLPPGWIATATTKQIGVRPGRGYGFQWWTYDDGSFAARGIFGQGIFINPQRRLVIATNSNWDSAVGQDSGQNPRREEFYREVMSALDAEEALHDGD